MKTLQEQIAATKKSLRERAKDARTELRTLEALAKVWPEEIPITQIYTHSIYGVSAGIKIGDEYTHNREDSQQTMKQVADLLDRFPPMPIYLIRNGCLAVRPDSDVSDEEAAASNAVPAWGVRLQVEAGINSGGPQQRVEWFARAGDMVIEITVILRPDCYPVRLDLDTRTDKRSGRVLEVRGTCLAENPQFLGNFWIDQRVKWGAAAAEYANKFTLYWIAIDDSTEGAGRGPGGVWLEQICGLAINIEDGTIEKPAAD